jgi:hypothetical protein
MPTRSTSSARSVRLLLACAVVMTLLPGSGTSRAAEPEPRATPKALCGPGSKPESGRQGRVPPQDRASGRSASGYSCNTTLLGSYGGEGGFKTLRYVDGAGRECAYFDVPTTSAQPGVRVLDMREPRKPVLTARLTTPAMLSPHESLDLNQRRGLLVAVTGNALTAPGVIDVYDLTADCRHPVLKSSRPVGVFGHESGFAPDGRTFYATAAVTGTIAAVDLTDPAAPFPVWIGPHYAHGLSLSADGSRAYLAGFPPGVLAPPGGLRDLAGQPGLTVLDVSEVQRRVPVPRVTVVSRLTWSSVSLPQNAVPLRIKGRPYLLEFDEFADLQTGAVGAARVIDIADERRPRVVSNLRLEVNQAANRASQASDQGAGATLGGYSAHYCAVPSRVDPGIVACSFILSGLRVFDLSDPLRPREVGYDSPPQPGTVTAKAMSAPVIVPERREVWYTDGSAGFRVVRLTAERAHAAPGALSG